MSARPYAQQSIVDLERLVEASADQAVLEQVLAELSHRSTPRAKRLSKRVEGLRAQSDGSAGARPAKTAPTEKKDLAKKAADGRKPVSGEGPVTRPRRSGATLPTNDEDWHARYEVLRETFTLEGEILARWGMTEAMPEDLRRVVFRRWQEIIGGEPDGLGRSAERLAIDLRRLQLEREGSKDLK